LKPAARSSTAWWAGGNSTSRSFPARIHSVWRAGGECPFVALPCFPRASSATAYIFINTRSGIHAPKDLEGSASACRSIPSRAIWARGHLAHQFNVDLESIRWVQGAVEKPGSHGRPHAPALLQSARIEQTQARAAWRAARARRDRRVDRLAASRTSSAVSRVARLFPNYRNSRRELYGQSRIFPIMHLIAIRRGSTERHRWIATSLYNAFVEAKRRPGSHELCRSLMPCCHADRRRGGD